MNTKILLAGGAGIAGLMWYMNRQTSSSAAAPTLATRAATTAASMASAWGAASNPVKITIKAPDNSAKSPVETTTTTNYENPSLYVNTGAGGVQNDGAPASRAAPSTLGLFQQQDIAHGLRTLDFSAGHEGQSAQMVADYMAQNNVSASDVGASIGWSGADVSQYIKNATGRTV
jgi:hypothetical protein